MAEIRPFRGWRYHPQYDNQIESLTSPPFDVVSAKQREMLYQNPINSIHLSVPRGENPNEIAVKTLEKWKKEQIIIQDELPAIYVYYQYFSIPGHSKEYCRKGFMCNIKAYDWSENIILRHENTIADAVNDRIELLAKTKLHASATHGLYTDTEHQLEQYMDEAIAAPIYELEDFQGVREVMGIIQDAEVIKKFIQVIRDKKIILADGHHRYEGSLVYRRECKAKNPHHTGKEAYNFHLMYLTNTEGEDLRILPTHRLFKNFEGLTEEQVITGLEPYFTIKSNIDFEEIPEMILNKKWAFGLVFKDAVYKIRLKPEAHALIDWNFPQAIKDLDLTVLHYFLIEKVLGIKREKQRFTDKISYERSFSNCLLKINKGEAQFAAVTREINMDEVKAVCGTGYTMPQKSTYFYPKVVCGLVYSSIDEMEFGSKLALVDAQFDPL